MRQGKFSKLIFSLTSGGSSPASDMLSTARGRRRESTGRRGTESQRRSHAAERHDKPSGHHRGEASGAVTPKDAARMEDGWLWVAVLDAFLLLMGLPALLCWAV